MLKEYQLSDPPQSFMINSFERLGWPDPFPYDNDNNTRVSDLQLNQKVMDDPLNVFIYPEGKMQKDQLPMSIYIPSKAIMFKLMRACIGIKRT